MFDPTSDYVDAATAENYRRVRRERGCSWSDLAREVAPTDSRLAAWMRQQDASEPSAHPKAAKRSQAPRGRRSAPRSEA